MSDPIAPILIALIILALGAAVTGRWVYKLGQPAVLGELLFGLIIGNVLYFFGEPVITVLREGDTIQKIAGLSLTQNLTLAEAASKVSVGNDRLVTVLRSAAAPAAVTVHQFLDLLARIGAIILLFVAGLDTSVLEMRRVGWTALLVAVVGMLCPFLLGLGATALLLPETPAHVDIFAGAILTATSVGITARVFRDLRQMHRPEAKVILGAAVLDDILGLVVLAVVSGLVVSGTIRLTAIAGITFKAILFLGGSLAAGIWIIPGVFRRMARLDIENLDLFFALGFAFLLSWLANLAGLATIVGAFAAGMVLERIFLKEAPLRALLAPLETLIIPVFFVLMGIQVKLETFADLRTVALAAVLTVCAAGGKMLSGLACSRRLNRLSVGIGMIPRGEVGLIFAGIGKGLGVVNDSLFSAVVIMVMATTLMTPPLLKLTLRER